MVWLKLFSFIILNSLILSASAQVFIGVNAGIDRNAVKTNIETLSFTENTPSNGQELDILFEISLDHHLSLKTSLSYLQKNYELARTGDYSGIYEAFSNSYIQMPLMMSYKLGNRKVKLFGNIGAFGSYWLAGYIRGLVLNIFDATTTIDQYNNTSETFGLSTYSQKYSFVSSRDRRFELGMAAGTGVDYDLSTTNKIRLEINFWDSFVDAQKTYMLNQDARINKSTSITLGFVHELKFK